MAIIALHSASTGLNALSMSLDVIANNLANANTEGFKSSRSNFQDLLYIEKQQPGVENTIGQRAPTGLYVGLGTKISGTQLNFEQGPALPTGRPLDVYIDGDGFFQVEIEPDVGEGIGYTRAGNFVINAEGDIVLANDQGRLLLPELNVPQGATNLSISANGIVSAELPGAVGAQELGAIEIATFINPAGLKQIGGNLYLPTTASGEPTVGEPGEDGLGVLREKHLEGSNVDPVTELVNLIKTQRAFELNSQSIQAADEVLQTVGNLRRF